MKKNNYPIFLLIFLFLLPGCQDVKKGFSGKNIDQGEEFLVIKKNPLVVPPDFEKMPEPKNEIDKSFKDLNLKDNASTHSLKEQLANLAFLTKAQYELGEVKRSEV